MYINFHFPLYSISFFSWYYMVFIFTLDVQPARMMSDKFEWERKLCQTYF